MEVDKEKTFIHRPVRRRTWVLVWDDDPQDGHEYHDKGVNPTEEGEKGLTDDESTPESSS